MRKIAILPLALVLICAVANAEDGADAVSSAPIETIAEIRRNSAKIPAWFCSRYRVTSWFSRSVTR